MSVGLLNWKYKSFRIVKKCAMDWIEVVGLSGSVLSSFTFMPQVYQTWKTKSVEDLNLFMILMAFISTIIWLVYGIGKGLLPVTICNGVICFLSLLLIYFKFRFAKK
jgi:MtN3 and saliva related transmembrane protein